MKKLTKGLGLLFAAAAAAVVISQTSVAEQNSAAAADFPGPGSCAPPKVAQEIMLKNQWQSVASARMENGGVFTMFADKEGKKWRSLIQGGPGGSMVCLAGQGTDMQTAIPGTRTYRISSNEGWKDVQNRGSPLALCSDVNTALDGLNRNRGETIVFRGKMDDGGGITITATRAGNNEWSLLESLPGKGESACRVVGGSGFRFADTFKPPLFI